MSHSSNAYKRELYTQWIVKLFRLIIILMLVEIGMLQIYRYMQDVFGIIQKLLIHDSL